MRGLSPIMKRLAVVYRGCPLMPMKESKVRRLVEQGRAKICFDRKLNIHYLKLRFEPSGFETQKIVLGVDTGSTFDGFTLLSKLCHHLNIELIHRPKTGKNSIKTFKKRQASERRVRRGGKWMRGIRFDNRTKEGNVPTINADIDFRKWLILALMKYYPFAHIVIEDVRFNHYRDLVGRNRLSGKALGASFSHVEVGKISFYNWLIDTGFSVEFVNGFETKEMRIKYLGGEDTKSLNKGDKSFEAHCLDSFIIAGKDFDLKEIELNRKTIFIEKFVKQRRKLTRTRKKYKDGCKYFRYAKGGKKVYFSNISRKHNVCRVKPEGVHSNHPKEWVKKDNGYAEKFKCNTAAYGGTVLRYDAKGNVIYNNGEFDKVVEVKYRWFQNNEWVNRQIEIVD